MNGVIKKFGVVSAVRKEHLFILIARIIGDE